MSKLKKKEPVNVLDDSVKEYGSGRFLPVGIYLKLLKSGQICREDVYKLKALRKAE